MPLYEPSTKKKSHRLHDQFVQWLGQWRLHGKNLSNIEIQILYTIKIVEIKLWPPLAHVKDTKPCW
jgi:hypothetical protein